MVVPVILVLRKFRLENHEFQTSLDYIGDPDSEKRQRERERFFIVFFCFVLFFVFLQIIHKCVLSGLAASLDKIFVAFNCYFPRL
jgi:hypothetical protein